MGSNIHVVGYLLAALVFSVGFLSERRHGHFDNLAKEAAERSWRIRQALLQGRPPGPLDLEQDLTTLEWREQDGVALATRLLNFVIALSCLVLGVLGVLAVLTTGETEATSPYVGEILPMTLLVVSAAGVTGVGEFDLSKMRRDTAKLQTSTLVGRLSKAREDLVQATERNSPSESTRAALFDEAFDILDSLGRVYPNWTFVHELAVQALVGRGHLQEAHERRETFLDAKRRLKSINEGSEPLSISPVLAAAVELEIAWPADGLGRLDRLEAVHGPSPFHDLLNTGLSLLAGRPQAMFASAGPDAVAPARQSELDIDLDSIPSISAMMEVARAWLSDIEADSWLKLAVGRPVEHVVRLALIENASDPAWKSLLEQLAAKGGGSAPDSEFEAGNSSALNTAGLICLSRNVHSDAIAMFERAIEVRPDSATSHWGRAVACRYAGWDDHARDSLNSARSLGLEKTLGDATDAFLRHWPAPVEKRTYGLLGRPLTGLDQLFFALIGVRIARPVVGSGLQGQILSRLIADALSVPKGEPND